VNKTRARNQRPSRSAAVVARLSFIVLALAPGCDLPGQPKLADKPLSEDKVVDFNRLYRRNCTGCHGTNGTLGPAPPLNDAVFLAIVPDSVLLRVISEGRPGTPMPAFAAARGGPLTDVQVKALAAGVKSRWQSPQSLHDSVPPYSVTADGKASDQNRGARVFSRACAPCHGPAGQGEENGNRSAGAINDPAFLALISDQALRRYAITGRPDLGMPNYADKTGRPHDYQPMTSAEIGDLVTFLASWRHADRLISSMGP
jgi:cytochrome c oxidase cbb3-type subunit III